MTVLRTFIAVVIDPASIGVSCRTKSGPSGWCTLGLSGHRIESLSWPRVARPRVALGNGLAAGLQCPPKAWCLLRSFVERVQVFLNVPPAWQVGRGSSSVEFELNPAEQVKARKADVAGAHEPRRHHRRPGMLGPDSHRSEIRQAFHPVLVAQDLGNPA